MSLVSWKFNSIGQRVVNAAPIRNGLQRTSRTQHEMVAQSQSHHPFGFLLNHNIDNINNNNKNMGRYSNDQPMTRQSYMQREMVRQARMSRQMQAQSEQQGQIIRQWGIQHEMVNQSRIACQTQTQWQHQFQFGGLSHNNFTGHELNYHENKESQSQRNEKSMLSSTNILMPPLCYQARKHVKKSKYQDYIKIVHMKCNGQARKKLLRLDCGKDQMKRKLGNCEMPRNKRRKMESIASIASITTMTTAPNNNQIKNVGMKRRLNFVNDVNNSHQSKKRKIEKCSRNFAKCEKRNKKRNKKVIKVNSVNPYLCDILNKNNNDDKSNNSDNSDNKYCMKVFNIKECLMSILYRLSIFEVFKYSRVCSFWYQQLNVKFWICNNVLSFEYESSMMKQMIERDLCENVKHLAMHYLQMRNYVNQGMAYVNYIGNGNGNRNENENERRMMKSNEHCKSEKLLSVSLMEPLRAYAAPTVSEDDSMTMMHLLKEPIGGKEAWRKIQIPRHWGNNNELNECDIIYQMSLLVNELKLLKEKGKFGDEICVDMSIFGELYNIIPIKTVLNDMIKSFPQTLARVNLRQRCPANFIWLNFMCTVGCSLQSFFAGLSLKGDFSRYLQFIEWNDNGIVKKVDCSGLLTFMSMFVRDDLVTQCRHSQWYIYSFDCLYLLLKPNMLNEYKKSLNFFMIPMTQEDETNLDIFKNENLYPGNRIKFLQMLFFSTKFMSQLVNGGLSSIYSDYPRLKRLIHDLFYNFDCFVCEWHLNEYGDYKDSIEKQKELHNDFCIVIQSLIGFARWFYDDIVINGRTRHESIIKTRLKHNEYVKEIISQDENELVDLKPSNLEELRLLYDAMSENKSERDLMNPWVDQVFIAKVEELGSLGQRRYHDVQLERLEFPDKYDAWSLFKKMWEIGEKYN